MMYPLVRDLAAKDAPLRVPITVACRVLGFSPQAFHRWVRNPVSDRDWDDAHLTNAAWDAHTADPEFGYRLISDELNVQGFRVSERRVWRLCSQQRVWSVFGKKKGRYRKAGPPAHEDLVKRDFTATAPNTLWLTDITEHKTVEGKVYLCAVKDVFANKIVGYSIDSRMKARLAVDALEMAVTHRGRPVGVVVHSDRGSQFRSKKYLRALKRHTLIGSMGQVGTCADNAAMESFFALLQKNVLNKHSWGTREQLRLAMIHWIERTYHRRRRQRRLGKLTPIEFETIMKDATASVA
jgi:putative transposase